MSNEKTVECGSCGNPVEMDRASNCLGVNHPEQGFCADLEMFFCPRCLNNDSILAAGYCDWCRKLRNALKKRTLE